MTPHRSYPLTTLVDVIYEGFLVLNTREHYNLPEYLLRERANNVAQAVLGWLCEQEEQ